MYKRLVSELEARRLSEGVKILMDKCRWSVNDLSRFSGLSVYTLSRWLDGDTVLSFESIVAVSLAFDISLYELFAYNDSSWVKERTYYINEAIKRFSD